MIGIHSLKGMRILEIRGERDYSYSKVLSKRKKNFEARYIMFDDGKTFIIFEDQDYYTFHDCSGGAKEIEVVEDRSRWEEIINNVHMYPVADMDV